MIKAVKYEKGFPPREMQFEEKIWKDILNLKDPNVRWERISDKPPTPIINDMEKLLSDTDIFEQAVKDGMVRKGKAGWYFFGDTNLGRLNDAVENFKKL